MVYHGAGQGITANQDGIEVGTDTVKANYGLKWNGDGHLIIGRWLLGGSFGTRDASAYVDELEMYNKQLSEEEICKMYWVK